MIEDPKAMLNDHEAQNAFKGYIAKQVQPGDETIKLDVPGANGQMVPIEMPINFTIRRWSLEGSLERNLRGHLRRRKKLGFKLEAVCINTCHSGGVAKWFSEMNADIQSIGIQRQCEVANDSASKFTKAFYGDLFSSESPASVGNSFRIAINSFPHGDKYVLFPEEYNCQLRFVDKLPWATYKVMRPTWLYVPNNVFNGQNLIIEEDPETGDPKTGGCSEDICELVQMILPKGKQATSTRLVFVHKQCILHNEVVASVAKVFATPKCNARRQVGEHGIFDIDLGNRNGMPLSAVHTWQPGVPERLARDLDSRFGDSKNRNVLLVFRNLQKDKLATEIFQVIEEVIKQTTSVIFLVAMDKNHTANNTYKKLKKMREVSHYAPTSNPTVGTTKVPTLHGDARKTG